MAFEDDSLDSSSLELCPKAGMSGCVFQAVRRLTKNDDSANYLFVLRPYVTVER